jgi:hypothetical protein
VLLALLSAHHRAILEDDDKDPNDAEAAEACSVHLTMNFDTRIWFIDYLSARRLAFAAGGVIVPVSTLGQMKDEQSLCGQGGCQRRFAAACLNDTVDYWTDTKAAPIILQQQRN